MELISWIAHYCIFYIRHGVNSGIGIDGQFRNWNLLFKKNELELRNLELEFPTKKLNPDINLPFLHC